jgi:hypothetical protein
MDVKGENQKCHQSRHPLVISQSAKRKKNRHNNLCESSHYREKYATGPKLSRQNVNQGKAVYGKLTPDGVKYSALAAPQLLNKL